MQIDIRGSAARKTQKGPAARSVCSGLFSPKLFYVILIVPHPSGKGAVCIYRWSCSFRQCARGAKNSFASPDAQSGKGGCFMTFEQVVLLLTLLGGAIYATFEITWKISNGKKK